MYNSCHPSNNVREGASIAIRRGIKYWIIDIMEGEMFHCVIIEIESLVGYFNFASVYAPPRRSCSRLDYENLLAKLGNRFLIGGDWSTNGVCWASILTNVNSINLEAAVNAKGGYFITPGKPTYFPQGKKKISGSLHFFVFNNHSPITLSMFIAPVLVISAPCLISSKTDWKKFQKTIIDMIDNGVKIIIEDNQQAEVDNSISEIQETVNSSVP